MGNPNNPWAFSPQPPPPGYAPPPPPPPKGLLAPPQGKRRGLALAMVCAMALAQLASAVMANFIDFGAGIVSSPLQLGLAAANLLIALLVFLKCVLPGWEPHRKILGWLLGVWVIGSLAGSVHGIIIGIRVVGSDFVIANIGGVIGGVFGALYGIVLSPQGILLFGVLAKKSTEKIAGLVSAVSFGLGLLAIPLLRFLSSVADAALGLPEALQIDSLLGSGAVLANTVAGTVLSLCWIVFLFTWPVLERPVLEKN